MKVTIWAYDTGFGLGVSASVTDQNLDMTKHGYILLQDVDIEASEEEVTKLVSENAEAKKSVKRAKLVAELEALDNE